MKLFLVSIAMAAAAVVHAENGAKPLRGSEPETKNFQFFDFNQNPFVISGFPLLPEESRLLCPDEWVDFVACTVLECPNLVDECPLSMFYDETSVPDLPELAANMNCSTVEESFCNTFGYDGCCMASCEAQILALASCVVKQTVGGRLRCWEAFDCAAYSEEGPMEGRVCFQEDKDNFSCIYTAELETSEETETWIDAIVTCSLNETIGFDVPNSNDCQCQATIDRGQGSEQVCDCSLCGEDEVQVFSLDCRSNMDNSFVVDSCPTLSCNNECVAPEKVGFLSNFDVELFADRSTITELNETDVTDAFYPMNFVPVIDTLFFKATSESTGYELWLTESSLNDTHLVKDINPGPQSSLDEIGSFALESAELDGLLMFFADDGVHGKELFRSDGTKNGTNLVRDIVDGSEGVSVSSFRGGSMLEYNGDLLFVVTDEDGTETLWKTDGTTDGTDPVGDNFVLPPSVRFNSVLETTSFDDNLYFVAKNKSSSSRLFLFVSDGTVRGTKQLSDRQIAAGKEDLIEFNEKIYFNAGSLWSTDGTIRSTEEVAGPDGATFTDPRSMMVVNSSLFFWSGCQLWTATGSSGSPMEYVLLLDHSDGRDCPNELTKLGERVLFRTRSNREEKPWVTDGTPEGTVALVDALLTSDTSFAVWEHEVAFFAAAKTDASFGHDLWVTDGSPANTHIIGGIGIDEVGLFPHMDNLFIFKNAVYMTVWYLFGPGHEIWRVNIAEDFDASKYIAPPEVANSAETTSDPAAETTSDLVTEATSDPMAEAQMAETVTPSLLETETPTEASSLVDDELTISRTSDGEEDP
ncbi:Inherit from bactNOG: Hyalin repeat protein [Seminavis robusta]|uniref:Inherit from bactNOG: Hyalin repeat protein n=1 Tax=Seminavis robusta TaxID=568900 RepID=A0A9N8DNL8_9STRA|nr:Inherit from bactNOG: Hyalin repeat protein [Seminavis robusta]|eukprot:Sro262_g101950.1 Inherit from bactNOG: Hyalin repeat protein (809) ;mRNA; r:12969-15479